MSRGLSAGLATEVLAPTVRPIILFAGEFASGWLRAWSGYGPLEWDSHTWQGLGHLGAVSPIEEGTEVRARGISITLTGIPSSLVVTALADCEQNSIGRLWIGFLNGAGALVDTPYLAFEGRLDVPVLEEAGDTARVTISYEDDLTDLERPRVRRYTDDDQKRRFPGDRGFEFVTQIQDQPIVWGRPS